MRIIRLILAAAVLCAALPVAAQAPEEAHVWTLIVDPGHGGADKGASGRKAHEKDITLAVAKRLRDMVEDKYGNEVNVVLTRESDIALALQDRADVANGEQGDLFISIHVNSLSKKARGREKVTGCEVYTCGLHKSESNLEVAMTENAVMELEPDYSVTYQGFDPGSAESYIIFELSQSAHLRRSVEFAGLAHDRLVSTAGRAAKGVKQAGFWVLWATSMPSVLVELDFISNPDSERFLTSAKGQDKCAQALFEAFCEYYDRARRQL